MTIAVRLNVGETLGDRVMKVDHAGEHGAICIYTAQKWFARWRAPTLLEDLDHFLAHERGHRDLFGRELARRGRRRCRSYLFCGLGGLVLGAITGLAGRNAIIATTVAVERVVLKHMYAQIEALVGKDEAAVALLRHIIVEEQEHHDVLAASLETFGFWPKIIDPTVALSTRVVIWLGMHL
jgi:ubiquinone biosynthesis monooxygenase Coq7